jgi:hypothetical protein
VQRSKQTGLSPKAVNFAQRVPSGQGLDGLQGALQ